MIHKLANVTENLDSRRVPVSKREREGREKRYPYYGAQGIVDRIDDYLFDGTYILVAEDGENLKSRKKDIALLATGKFWVNNHAHILGEKEGFNLRYVYYYLKSIDLSGYITGSAQPKLTQENLARVPIVMPDKPEQDRIAYLLQSLDEKIINNTRIISELESIAKELYDYWFVQFDFPDKNGRPYKACGGKMIANEKAKRALPEGWEVERLGRHITPARGISYNSEDLLGEGVPMINLASFNVDSTYKHSGLKTFSGRYATQDVLRPLDLVMCNTQQTAIDPEKDIIGKTILVPAIFDGDVVSSHHVTRIQCDKDYLKYYINATCRTEWFHKYISGFASGTNILGLDFRGVSDFLMVMPPDPLLKQFATISRGIEEYKSIVIKENAELEECRNLLLPLLMSGQVSVK